jgi:hypothetical protein
MQENAMRVELDERQWQTVLALMAYAPGRECIPLINEISKQLQQPAKRTVESMPGLTDYEPKGNSGERHNVRGD